MLKPQESGHNTAIGTHCIYHFDGSWVPALICLYMPNVLPYPGMAEVKKIIYYFLIELQGKEYQKYQLYLRNTRERIDDVIASSLSNLLLIPVNRYDLLHKPVKATTALRGWH